MANPERRLRGAVVFGTLRAPSGPRPHLRRQDFGGNIRNVTRRTMFIVCPLVGILLGIVECLSRYWRGKPTSAYDVVLAVIGGTLGAWVFFRFARKNSQD